MLIKGAILVVLIIAAFFFLGIKMSESITNPGIRGFFFALYFITIFTVFNIILSFYFIIKLQGKRGPQGKKGLQGSNGDRGEPGTCDNTTCKKKTVELLIRNKIEEHLVNDGGLTENENKVMCAIFKKFHNDVNEENITMTSINNPSNTANTLNKYLENINIKFVRKNKDINGKKNGIHDFIVEAIKKIDSGFLTTEMNDDDFNC